MVKLIYTIPAIINLKNFFLYISNDSVVNAKLFTTALKDHIKKLKEHPEIGRQLFPNNFPSIRQILYKSYKIIYSYKNEKITIYAISHQSRPNTNIEAIKQFYI